MRVLVIHQNFPGQFGHIARAWSMRPGWDVRGLGRESAPGIPGFEKLQRYRLARPPQARQHPYLRQIESSTLHGQAVVRALLAMRRDGFTPDVVLAHPGWGESMYVKDVYPNAHVIHLCEWYYNSDGADMGFDPEFPTSFDDRIRVRNWNAQHALNVLQCEMAVSPTAWQRSRFPALLQSKIVVQHEGIDTGALGPDIAATLALPNGTVLRAGDPVITYVARNLEPYRGFHIFMRALERIQKRNPHCHTVIIGGNETSYGGRPKEHATWREQMLAEVSIDPARTHFLGRVPRATFVRALQVSAAHVYLTYPFVLSWSLLEAMACGAPLIASDTAPVREVLEEGVNARLVDFFDISGIAEAAAEALENPAGQAELRREAYASASRYSLSAGLKAYDGWLPADSSSQKFADSLARTTNAVTVLPKNLERALPI